MSVKTVDEWFLFVRLFIFGCKINKQLTYLQSLFLGILDRWGFKGGKAFKIERVKE